MKRGQEEAPVELLIGVTILTFVLILGFYTYQHTCRNQFEQKMKASLSSFARDLELVYMGAVGSTHLTSLDFSKSGCPGEVEAIRLVKGTDTLCINAIGHPDCLVLVLSAREPETTSTETTPIILVEAVDISRDVTVELKRDATLGGDCTPTDDGFQEILNPTGPLECVKGWQMIIHTFRIEKTENKLITIYQ